MLMLSLGVFTVEVTVADVHDGDATATEIAKATGTAQGANASMDGPVAQDSHSHESPSSETGHHAAHSCHCTHAHGGITVDSSRLDAPGTPVRSTLMLAELTPDAVDLDVSLRPPIAA